MKTKLLKLFTTASVAVAIATACNSPQKSNNEAPVNTIDSTVTSMAPDTLTQARKDWEAFKEDANEKIRQNKDSIEAFKAKMDKTGKKMKAKFEKRTEELKEKNEELKARLDNFKDEGKEKWDKFKYDFKRDMDTLDVKWKELTKEDKKG